MGHIIAFHTELSKQQGGWRILHSGLGVLPDMPDVLDTFVSLEQSILFFLPFISAFRWTRLMTKATKMKVAVGDCRCCPDDAGTFVAKDETSTVLVAQQQMLTTIVVPRCCSTTTTVADSHGNPYSSLFVPDWWSKRPHHCHWSLLCGTHPALCVLTEGCWSRKGWEPLGWLRKNTSGALKFG